MRFCVEQFIRKWVLILKSENLVVAKINCIYKNVRGLDMVFTSIFIHSIVIFLFICSK